MHVNTVLSAVHWELIEPPRGKFDFSLVDSQIRDAPNLQSAPHLPMVRKLEERGIQLHPGLGEDQPARFPRVQNKDGKGSEILSTLSSANRDADARAFAPSCGTSSKWTRGAGSS